MRRPEFDPLEIIKAFNREGIRYILIGRQAVVQYGAPLFSFDYDFWIDPEDRFSVYRLLERLCLSGKYSSEDKRPVDSFSDDEGNKIDVFFVKAFDKPSIGISLDFDKVYERSVVKKDPDSDFYVRIPSIDDLIKLKQLGELRPKDLEDIEYLKKLKEIV
ncbi:MAG: hypothetical protein N2257_01900 [Thermodesulfovibrionales bacterium]|nr:hypothetical protein [Thermodesulfovibrionales bacterium]